MTAVTTEGADFDISVKAADYLEEKDVRQETPSTRAGMYVLSHRTDEKDVEASRLTSRLFNQTT